MKRIVVGDRRARARDFRLGRPDALGDRSVLEVNIPFSVSILQYPLHEYSLGLYSIYSSQATKDRN